jgi:hypothetical protein
MTPETRKLKDICPCCARIYIKTTDENYCNYVLHLNVLFKEQYAWPFCMSCYNNLVELCDTCGMVLTREPIYWLSSALKAQSDHVCSDCFGQ